MRHIQRGLHTAYVCVSSRSSAAHATTKQTRHTYGLSIGQCRSEWHRGRDAALSTFTSSSWNCWMRLTRCQVGNWGPKAPIPAPPPALACSGQPMQLGRWQTLHTYTNTPHLQQGHWAVIRTGHAGRSCRVDPHQGTNHPQPGILHSCAGLCRMTLQWPPHSTDLGNH